MPTLVMMHGMTGTAEMMRPFAEKVLPEGWNLLVPEAEFDHPNRGFTWWRYEGGDQPGRRILSATELSDVDSSLLKLSNMLPDDKLVLGGFSQGGAMAQELLQFDLDVLGIIAIGTRVVRPLELRQRLQELQPAKLLWMHGESDHRSGEMDAFSDRLVLYKREDEATIRTEEEDNAHHRHQRAVHLL